MTSEWRRLEKAENDAAWDAFYARFRFVPTGGKPARAIRDPRPSVTFDLGEIMSGERPGYGKAALASIETAARRAFLAEFGEEVELLVLDWQHEGYMLRPAKEVPEPLGLDEFPLIPSVYPDGDYYIYATPDLEEGTFGHPWEKSLCVFGTRLTRTLGRELRTWLPVLRENS